MILKKLIQICLFRKKNLFLSLGHTNTILLINQRQKILWKLHDKLFHQHDVDINSKKYINNNRIFANKDQVYENNEIMVYNFTKDSLSSPYEEILSDLDVRQLIKVFMRLRIMECW